MAVSKCWLCNHKLKGGEGQLKLIDGTVRKICVDKRACELRQKMKKMAQADTEEETDDADGAAAVMAEIDKHVTLMVLTALTAFVLGLAVGKLLI